MLKKIGKELLLFFTSKVVLKSLIKMALLVGVLLFLTFKGLKLYTNHGQQISVDQLEGLHIDEAMRLAEDRGFKVQITDSLFMVNEQSNRVIKQNPPSGALVKENRTIYVTITKKTADLRKLPNLVGNYNFDQYAKKLKRLSINASIKDRIFDGRQEENSILYLLHEGKKITEADIKRGYKVPMGGSVQAVVTYRHSVTTDMPDLACRTLSEAEFLLESLDLKIGEILPQGDVEDQGTAYIVRQSPNYQPGTLINKGTPFTLFIQKTKPDNCP